jgi:hypothetical protein
MTRFAAALLLSLCFGCKQSGLPVRIVVPAGFSGPVWIVEDARSEKKIPERDGAYRVELPASGVLRVSSLQPFRQWHLQSASYADGSPLPCAGVQAVPDHAVALRGGQNTVVSRGARSLIYIGYYVGTEAQARKFQEQADFPPE